MDEQLRSSPSSAHRWSRWIGAALFLVLWAGSSPVGVLAQGIVEGTVLDGKTDEPIPGAQVVVAGTSIGAATDVQGAFRITGVPAGEQTIRAQFVGYGSTTKTVVVEDGQTSSVDFTLRESAINLEEVVVTGAGGSTQKRKLGNTIATITSANLEVAPISTFSEMLQGREPGVVGLPSGGLTGEGARIRIRGTASLTQSNEPLVYIDGIRVNNGGGFGGLVDTGGGGVPSRLDDINPNSIKSVEVLKGAAAATLYGTEASNGVLQIFTKRGQQGDVRATFRSEITASQYPDTYPDQVGFTTTQNRANTVGEVLGRDVQPYQLISQNVARELTNTTGVGQTYSGTVSGGSDIIQFFVSGRYQTEDGPFETEFIRNPDYPSGTEPLSSDEVTRAQGSANLTITPSEEFQLLVSTGYTDTQQSSIQTNNNIYGTISLAQFSKPELIAPNNRSGTIAFATVNESLQQTVEQDVQHFFGTVNGSYAPSSSLGLEAKFGVDYTSASSIERRPFGWNIDGFSSDTPDGQKAFSAQENLYLTTDLRARHQVEFGGDFTSDFTVGAQGFTEENTIESGQGTSFPGPGFDVTDAAAEQALFEDISEIVNLGVFAQEQVGFRDYLFATVGARYDANSAFGDDFSGVFYPKASVSFIPTDSPLLDESDVLSSLRLRAAVGKSGLQPGAFDALTTFTSLSSGTGAGVVPDNLGNPDLEPEVSTEWEVGFDAGLFSDRLSVEATYWNRTVNDALVDRQFAPTGGFRSSQLVNIGQLKAQGVEVSLRGNAYQSENFALDVFANTAYLYQQVEDLGGAPPIKVGGSYPRYRNYLVEGFAPGAHFGVQLRETPAGSLPVDLNGDGAPDTEEELLGLLGGLTPETASLPSSLANVLIGSNPDSPTGQSSDFYLGKPTPDFQGAFGFDATVFGNWTVSTLFEYKAGNYYVNNLTDAFRQANASIGRNLPESARVERDYVTGGVDESGTPRNSGEVRLDALKEWLNEHLALAPFSGLNTIERADFLRFRELSLSYRLPSRFLEGTLLRRARITLAGRNLFLLTKYDGVDPELNAVGRGGGGNQLENNFLSGVEAFGFPIPRQYSFKLQLGF